MIEYLDIMSCCIVHRFQNGRKFQWCPLWRSRCNIFFNFISWCRLKLRWLEIEMSWEAIVDSSYFTRACSILGHNLNCHFFLSFFCTQSKLALALKDAFDTVCAGQKVLCFVIPQNIHEGRKFKGVSFAPCFSLGNTWKQSTFKILSTCFKNLYHGQTGDPCIQSTSRMETDGKTCSCPIM